MAHRANFKVDPRLTKILGESYRSTEYAIKELVDNAWDADAEHINIFVPTMMTGEPIVIEDDGSGMTEAEVRQDYLAIANDRRSRKGDRTHRLMRRVKGSKGIGKFAGLMVADIMQIETIARGRSTCLTISKEDILAADRDLERIALPLIVAEAEAGKHGTRVSLANLNQHYENPSAEKLKMLLVLEYGREENLHISVNGDLVGFEDIPGEEFYYDEAVSDAGDVRMRLKISDSGKPFRQPGIVVRVGGKVVGRPNFWGLENDPEIPAKLLKNVYGEIEADDLVDSLTADWGDLVENSKGMSSLIPFVQERIKTALGTTFKREVAHQRARIEKQFDSRVSMLPGFRRMYAEQAIERVIKRFYTEPDEKVDAIVSVVLDAIEKDEYWAVIQQINETKDADIATLAESFEQFGLIDMAAMLSQAKARLAVLDVFEERVINPDTLESKVHEIVEKNLWILGMEYTLLASNVTLQRVVSNYADKLAVGRKNKRPDLFLGHGQSGGHLLIEFKRPSKAITREDQMQAVKYRDDLEPKFGPVDVLLIGKARDVGVTPANDPPRLRILGYEAIISSARSQLDWLIREMSVERAEMV